MSAVNSCCSDLREMNEAKVQNILHYLEDVDRCGGDAESLPPSASLLSLGSLRQLASAGGQRSAGTAGFALNDITNYHPTGRGDGIACVRPQSTAAASVASLALTGVSGAFGGDNGAVFHGIKRKIDELKRANEGLQADNAGLQSQVAAFRDREEQRVAKIKAAAAAEVSGMREALAASQKEHLQTVAKLIKEKEALVRRADDAAAAMREAKEELASSARRQKDAHESALCELQGKWALQEKQRREQWAAKEAKRIKEATLKAMEPDIALLMNRHKGEKARMAEEHEHALRHRDERLAEKEAALVAARLQMGRELEDLVGKEREAFRRRAEDEAARYRQAADEQRRAAEEKAKAAERFWEDQRQHYASTIGGLEAQILALKSSTAEESGRFHAAVANEVDRQMKVREAELQQRRAAADADAAHAEQARQREAAEALRRREEEIRAEARKERDAAVAKVIKGLEDEHMRGVNADRETRALERERAARQEREASRLAVEKDLADQQVQQLMAQVREQGAAVSRLETELKKLREGKADAAEECERQFEHRLHMLDAMWQQKLQRFEVKHVEEVGAATARAETDARTAALRIEGMEAEVRALEQRHNAELSSINDRVVAAVAKREATITMLQEQLRHAQALIHERDADMERHRQLL